MLRSLFINPQEHRLRALWRLILHFVFFTFLVVLISIIIGLIVGLLIALSGGSFSPEDINRAIFSHPLARPLTAVGSLVAMTLSLLVFARWVDKRPVADYGFHFSPRWWADLAFGLFLGAILMVLIFGVERAAGWLTVTGMFQSNQPGVPYLGAMLGDLLAFLCVGIYEEMLSRGYQTKNLAEGLNLRSIGPRLALLLAFLATSTFFGWLHAGNPNATLVSTVNIMVAGLFLGLGFVLTGELAIPIGIHITWNFFQGSVFGFPVSGTTTASALVAIEQGGPEAWTGGTFGPEAGWLGLLAMVLGAVLIYLWVRARYGRAGLREEIAVYPSTPPQYDTIGRTTNQPTGRENDIERI